MCKEFNSLPSAGGIKDQAPNDIARLLQIMDAHAKNEEFEQVKADKHKNRK